MNTVRDVLVKARELISDPRHWIQGNAARNASGVSINPDSPEAVCWCSMGAIEKIDSKLYFKVTSVLGMVMGDSIFSFNDNSSHEDVLAAFDIAIALES